MRPIDGERERLEAVGQLAAGVAHDYNNLLGVVRNSADFIRFTAEAAGWLAEVERDLDEIVAAVHQGTELTRRLMLFARRQEGTPRPVDMAEIVEEALLMLDRTLGERIDVVRRLAPVPLVVVDRSQAEQAVVNLALNARDAMPTGGTLTVTVAEAELGDPAGRPAIAPPGRYVLVQLRDDGTGMAEGVRARALEPFFTTKGEAGTGLGLASVYGVATQAGGGVVVGSALGEGTVVSVYLPAWDGPGRADAARDPS